MGGKKPRRSRGRVPEEAGPWAPGALPSPPTLHFFRNVGPWTSRRLPWGRSFVPNRYYLTAKTDRFLVVSKESIMTPKGDLGGTRTGQPGRDPGSKQLHTSWSSSSQNSIPGHDFECPEPNVGHFVVFEFPEVHSRATF